MAISTLPLSYCTNVHPGVTIQDVESGLDDFTVPVRENFAAPLAAGLWLAAPVVAELLASADSLPRFQAGMERRGLSCHTLNAFPFGNFHSRRVKESVYLPDWADPQRLNYTRDCARILAALMPDSADGSISTVPLAFKGFSQGPGHAAQCLNALLDLAADLKELEDQSGRRIRLAIEPEPFCLLETTAETLSFFERLWECAAERGMLQTAREYLGVCYDVCHQAVEFEDIPGSIAALAAAGIRINKVHITCALELLSPATNQEGREALAGFVEERYLHQVIARTADGSLLRCVDLTRELALNPPEPFRAASAWRIHFHVPVNREEMGVLRTTRGELKQALQAVSRLDYAPHLEVETYTWGVLPAGHAAQASLVQPSLIEGLSNELLSTRQLLVNQAGTAARGSLTL